MPQSIFKDQLEIRKLLLDFGADDQNVGLFFSILGRHFQLLRPRTHIRISGLFLHLRLKEKPGLTI